MTFLGEKAIATSHAAVVGADEVHTLKLAALGRLAAHLAHQFNAPLTVLSGNVQPLRKVTDGLTRLLRDHPDLEVRRLVGELAPLVGLMERGIGAAALLATQVREFSRSGSRRRIPVEVERTLDACLSLLATSLGGRIVVKRSYAGVGAVAFADGQLDHVLLNLLANACDAIADAGTIVVATRAEGDAVEIVIEDDGRGMTAAEAARSFEPFFTTKGPAEGTGLGLAIVAEIVHAHGGTVAVETDPGAGARFSIRLRRDGDAGSVAPLDTAAPHHGRALPGGSDR